MESSSFVKLLPQKASIPPHMFMSSFFCYIYVEIWGVSKQLQ